MSLNPKLNNINVPILENNKNISEELLMEIEKIWFEIKLEAKSQKADILYGSGILYLTNFRIVLINNYIEEDD